ncbi:MAG: tryptophan--tRNA ligase [Azospirillum brasilense]|nr:MAG: tryptophan--tRNA ligase [Azospirillum brasilense]
MTQFKEKAKYQNIENLSKELSEVIDRHVEKNIELVDFIDSNEKFSFDKSHRAQNLFMESYHRTTEIIKLTTEYTKATNRTFDDAKLGLFAYPVLMAADILGYKATHVPVGADQKQHLELARDIAGAFNRAYGEDFFPLPNPMIMPTAARVMSLTDGTKKMSKSDPSDYSRITLMDDADAIATKIKKAQTDSEPSLSYDPENRPSVSNLIGIYAALEGGSTPQQVVAQFANLKTGQFKAQLAELAVAKLSPITTHMRELMADTTTLDGILKRGAQAANDAAQPVLRAVKQRVGFLQC